MYFLSSLIFYIKRNISFARQMQPRVSIKSPLRYVIQRADSIRTPTRNQWKIFRINFEENGGNSVSATCARIKVLFYDSRCAGVVKLNNEWGLTSCAGLLGGSALECPVALMSGGSRRLWNQLLRGTPSFVLYLFRSALTLARFAFARYSLALILRSLYLPPVSLLLPHILPISISLRDTERERFIPYRKKLLGPRVTENRFRERSAESKFSPPARTHSGKDTAISVL